MEIPTNALVVVADGRKMLLFRNTGDATAPTLEAVAHDDHSGSAKGSNGTSDSEPTGDTTVTSNHDQSNFHQQAEDLFAVDVAAMLKDRVLRHEYDKLIVVAPPKTLGEIRKHYHKEVESRLVGEIAKDVTHRPLAEILSVIAGS